MSDPVNAWLAAQRDMMERWSAASQSTAPGTSQNPFQSSATVGDLHGGAQVQSEIQRWWQAVAQDASPQAQALAQQLTQLGPSFLAGAGDALFDLMGTGPAGQAGDAAGRMLDLAPIGYFREHQAHAQALGRALGEYGRIAAQMASAIARIHTDALELLAKKTAALASANDPVTDTRRLYGLWIECSEKSFAEHARGEIFGRLQGELVNAGVQVRIAQQTIAEYFLKSLDLPTRAELNSVHKRLKEMRERLEQLEAAALELDPKANRMARK